MGQRRPPHESDAPEELPAAPAATRTTRREGLNIMRNIIVPALAALSLAAFTTPVSAQTTSVTVPIADLDLSTEAGQATLESRIAAATGRICGQVEVRKVREGADKQRCLEETEASVRVEISRITARDPALAANR